MGPLIRQQQHTDSKLCQISLNFRRAGGSIVSYGVHAVMSSTEADLRSYLLGSQGESIVYRL